jgi:hypothetical protein
MSAYIKRGVFKQFPTCSKMATAYPPDCTIIARSNLLSTVYGTNSRGVNLPGCMEGVIGFEGQENCNKLNYACHTHKIVTSFLSTFHKCGICGFIVYVVLLYMWFYSCLII